MSRAVSTTKPQIVQKFLVVLTCPTYAAIAHLRLASACGQVTFGCLVMSLHVGGVPVVRTNDTWHLSVPGHQPLSRGRAGHRYLPNLKPALMAGLETGS